MKSKKLSQILFSLFFLTAVIIACKHEPILPSGNSNTNPTDKTGGTNPTNPTPIDLSGWKCSTDTVYFQYDVLPILVSACATETCHDAKSKTDGYQLTDYANIVKKGISAGRATQSKIYTEIMAGSMPPRNLGIVMTTAQKDILKKWIDQGAKNLVCNSNLNTCDTTNVKYSTFVATFVKDKCEGCHMGTNAGGGVRLTNYNEIKTWAQSGKLYKTIVHETGVSAMPKGISKLPLCETDRIKAWINRGAQNN